MLAHGTGVCQWQAVIVFLFFGGVWMHDPMVQSFVTSGSEENCVVAYENSRLKENFCAHVFTTPTIASEAQECDLSVYPAEVELWDTFNASSEVGLWTNFLEGQNSRLKKNVYAYDFMASHFAYGTQEYGPAAYSIEEAYLDILISSTEDNMDKNDLVFQMDYVGHPSFDLDHPDQRFQRHEYQGRTPSDPDFLFLLFCFVSNVVYAKWKNNNAMSLISKSSDWVAWGQRRRTRYSYNILGYAVILFWFILFGLCDQALAVTCRSCFDGIAGCAGGAACPFATQTAANLAVLAVAGGAAIDVASLIPSSYVRHLPTQVLRTLAAIARVPVAGGPPDLGAMSLAELSECLASGRIETTAYKNELNARLADPATVAGQVTRISAMLTAAQSNGAVYNSRVIEGISSYGVLGYLVAAASLIVNTGKRTYSSGTVAAGSSSCGGTALSIRAPTSGSQFAELLMVWQTLTHAVGAANFLATVPFLQQVVWDGISTLGLLWEQAYCLFIIYLEAIEDSRGVLNLANVFAAGAQDTRIRAANQRHLDMFSCQPCDDQDDKGKDRDKGSKKWNGKDSPNASGVCKTYNFKDAEHPKQHLHKDGTCKFPHVCSKWVTGKGPGGMCEGSHPMYSCTNPNKTNTKPTQ